MQINLEHAELAIAQHGPKRVIINGEGEAVSSLRARRDHGITPDVIFIRRDGWSLGAPAIFERLAYRQWKLDWIAFWRRGRDTASPIREYRRPE